MEYTILDKINTPEDVKKLNNEELNILSEEIREFLVQSISKTGGHLASNLGVVELTLAIESVFNLPKDKVVFDVGHQCYAYKMTTGRKEKFDMLRKKGGISGFPKPEESIYDSFITGHASTSISAAYGIAKANALKGNDDYVVAVIGDGALSGGEAYEALNNAGRGSEKIIIIVNHNAMSISKNVGAFARYLSRTRSKPFYLKFKTGLQSVLNHTPLIGKPILKWLEHSKSILKRIIYRSTFFEEMGFSYLGPVDGHNIEELKRALNRAKLQNKPAVIQVETKKGKGFTFAEENPGAYHAVSTEDMLNGGDNTIDLDCYSNIVGEEIVKLAANNDEICAITAAMKYATGLKTFSKRFRNRFFDVGIAEEHAVTFAGGLASQGFLPVFCVYSTFLQRSYDQIIHDLAIDNKRAVLCVDRAGIVGADGETHNGVMDAAFLSQITNVTVYSPDGYEETRRCVKEAVLNDNGVSAVRYPRGKDERDYYIPISTEYSYEEGKDVLLVSYGREFKDCYDAKKELKADIGLLKLTKISPIPKQAIELAEKYKAIVFYEEGIKKGGIGEQFALKLIERSFKGKIIVKAIDNGFIKQGSVEEIKKELGLDKESIIKVLQEEV